ncbi:MAG: hypothetical protein VCC00_04485 [Deltaproteobacteria bacterium]
MFERSKSARLTAAFVAAGSLALVGVAQADVAAGDAVIVGEEVVVVEAVECADCAAGNNGMVSISAGVDFSDKYFFRGYTQQIAGLQVQPWAEIGIQLVDNGAGHFGDVSLFFGTWNSINTKGDEVLGGQSPHNWYESDFYAGISTSLGHGLSASVSYIAYTYPSTGGDIGEIDIALSYDDSDLLGAFALSPYATFAFEIHRDQTAFEGNNAGYFEFGIEPGCTVLENSDYPVSISTPVALGVSMYEGYFGDNDLGWGTVGAVASVPLAFVPAGYGDWSVAAGVYGIWQSAAIRTGSAWQPNFGMGISMDY